MQIPVHNKGTGSVLLRCGPLGNRAGDGVMGVRRGAAPGKFDFSGSQRIFHLCVDVGICHGLSNECLLPRSLPHTLTSPSKANITIGHFSGEAMGSERLCHLHKDTQLERVELS